MGEKFVLRSAYLLASNLNVPMQVPAALMVDA